MRGARQGGEPARGAGLHQRDGLSAFSVDGRALYAVVLWLEIISEASRRVDEETRRRHPHLAWRQIAGAGNVYRHAYESVDPDMVWRTVTERMNELLTACEADLSLDGDASTS